ncbi:MAG: protein phosphatase 2C domain-containing protein [Bacteroidales bacterium]|nr:protein phosphatase 2C domain-containing protein [Bacteroidales bacterium]
MIEKEARHGEDAPPLLIQKRDSFAVGVFDGMGGAGATICESSSLGVGHTQAYVSSRIVCSSMDKFLQNCLPAEDIDIEEMKAIIKRTLSEEKEKFAPKAISSLRSRLIREYPTTMAIVTLYEKDNSYKVDSYWAGDSHCYLWTRNGFYQISKDDLEEDNDPMENLHNDAAVSNCICADRDFRINHKQIDLSKEPVIIISATDGCFGYLPTPMHFEDMLKRCLKKANDEEEWKKLLMQSIQEVTGDDTSLALIGIGFESFGKFKNIMALQSVSVVGKLRDLESNITSQKQKLTKMQREYEQIAKSGWESYKQKYLKFINDDNNANA